MKEVTAKTYDEHIISQGLEFQAEKYYSPKEIPLKKRIKAILGALNPQTQETILDIGCGVGTFAYQAARHGAKAFGIDYSEKSIVAARSLCARYGVKNNTGFVVGNATELPFKSLSFDKIVAADFIEHITVKDKERLLGEVRRLLKPGGIFVVFTPNGIREKIGEVYWKIRHVLFKDKIPTTDLHFGLISRYGFETLLKKYNFNFKFQYEDITRPYLAKMPLIRRFLALNLLWKIRK